MRSRCSRRAEPQFLDIRVPTALQRIDPRPPQLRPELPKKSGQRQDFRLDFLREFQELRVEFVGNFNNPTQDLFWIDGTLKEVIGRVRIAWRWLP
jgi:hypothetical protein